MQRIPNRFAMSVLMASLALACSQESRPLGAPDSGMNNAVSFTELSIPSWPQSVASATQRPRALIIRDTALQTWARPMPQRRS